MNTNTQPLTPAAGAPAPAQAPFTDGKRFVRAIIRYLKEKGRTCVTFEKSTYGDWNDIPFCNHFQEIIDTVSLCDEDPDRIVICVCTDGGAVFYEAFDGTEDEDFDFLFHEVYYYINSADAPEAEEWLDNYEARLTAGALMNDLDTIADEIADAGGMNISYCASIDMTVFPSVVILALPDDEYNSIIEKEKDRIDLLGDLRFLARNENKIPKSFKESTLEDIRKYVVENCAKVFEEIRSDANIDYYDYLGKDYRFSGIPDEKQPRFFQ